MSKRLRSIAIISCGPCEWKHRAKFAMRLARNAIRADFERKRLSLARPRVVCLCGSTRFWQKFEEEAWKLNMAGVVTLSLAVYPGEVTTADGGHVGEMLGGDTAAKLDELHLRKIDLADEVRVINVDGYIGESTRREIAYAIATGKDVTYLSPLGVRP